MKRSQLAKLELFPLFLSELFWAFKITRKEKVDLIHSHWLIPSGLVGSIVSGFFGISHITTAHAGDVFTMEKLKFLRPIWNLSSKIHKL